MWRKKKKQQQRKKKYATKILVLEGYCSLKLKNPVEKENLIWWPQVWLLNQFLVSLIHVITSKSFYLICINRDSKFFYTVGLNPLENHSGSPFIYSRRLLRLNYRYFHELFLEVFGTVIFQNTSTHLL